MIDARDRKLLADGLFNRSLHALALPEYQELASRQPPPPGMDEILYRLGECQRHLRRIEEAEVSFRRAAAEFPQSPLRERAVLMRGLLILEMGRPAVSAELLENLLAVAKADEILITALYHAGEAREKSGAAEAAIAHYQELRRRNPAHELAAYAGLRLAHLQARDMQPAGIATAMALYRELADKPFNPRSGAEALFQAATLAYHAGDFENSARLYRLLSESHPGDQRVPEAARPAAWAHMRTGRFSEALQYAQVALADDAPAKPAPAERAEWLYIAANCLRMLERRPEALASYDALLAESPSSPYAPAARYERLLTLYKQAEYARVLKDAAAFADPPPEIVPDLLWLQADAAEALKDGPRAIQFYRLLLQKAPQDRLAPDAAYRLAHQFQAQQAWGEASRAYLHLVENWPTNAMVPQALFASGCSLARAGQSDGALRDWRQLLTRFPRHELVPETLFQKALEETKRDGGRAAAETLDQLLRDHPAYTQLDEARFWRAQHAYAAGELELAESLLRACRNGKPPLAIRREADFLLGLVLQATGRDEEAAACFQPLLKAPVGDKFTVDRLQWLAEFQYGRKAFGDSEAAARAMLTRSDLSPEWRQAGHTLLARALRAGGNRTGAIAACRQALEVGARTRYGAEAALRLGEMLLEEGGESDVAAAEAALAEAAKRAATPDLQDIRAYAYAGLARAAEQRDDKTAAIRYHMSVAILFDDDQMVPLALDRAATLLAEAGRGEESRAAAAELAERYPASPQARRRHEDSRP